MAPVSTRLIQETDDTNFFGSGRQVIDDWLSAHALRQHQEKRLVTYVWEEQGSIRGFFSLTPHSLTDIDVSMSGHARGPLTGYLIAKIGMWTGAVDDVDQFTLDSGKVIQIEKPVQLVTDAVIAASRASKITGGRYLFINTTNEPPAILTALYLLGFKSINPAAAENPTYFFTLR